MTEPQQPPETPPERATFDVLVTDALRDAFHQIFLRYPEVKCLATSITWSGGLNDAQIIHGVWLSANGDGSVRRPDEVVGSINQTLKMLGEQLSRGFELADYLGDRVQLLGTEILKREEQVKQLEEQIQARGGRVPGGGQRGSGGPAEAPQDH